MPDPKKTDAAARARSIGVLSQNHYVGYAFSVEEVVRLGRYAHRGCLLSSRKAEDEAAAYGDTRDVMRPEILNAVFDTDVAEWMRTMLSQWKND